MEEYISYHRIISLFEEYQQSQIGVGLNSFGHGNIVMFGQTDSGMTPTYPMMFVSPQTVDYLENTTNWSIQILFADRINDDMSNEIDVISDMSIQAKRFISYIKRGFDQTPPLYNYMDCTLPVSSQTFLERFNDYVGGIAITINLEVFEDINACDYYDLNIFTTPTNTPSQSCTPTPTTTISATPSATPTNTPSNTPSGTPPVTPSVTPSNTPSVTPSITPSKTPSQTPSNTPSVTPSITASKTPTQTPTNTPTNTPSNTPSTTPSQTPSQTPSNTPSVTPSITASNTPTPSVTASVTPSITPSITASNTPTNTPTPSNTPPPSGTTEARAYMAAVLSAGGTLSSTISAATETLFTSLVSAGLWDKIQQFYPLLGGTGPGCAIEGKTATTNITWNGGMTFSSSGAKSNGTNAYGNIGYNDLSLSNLDDFHLSFYSNESLAQSDQITIGVSNGTDRTSLYIYDTSNDSGMVVHSSLGYAVDTNDTTSLGYYIGQRDSSTNTELWKNGVKEASSLNSSSNRINGNYFVFARNNSGTPGNYTPRRSAFITLGRKLSAANIASLQSAVHTFNTTLGRNY